ncbi:hypothetical protein PMAC_003323 [Pneumocystis sp. 'macacae']|nr:hypothetical protein PMAC_003323 [Pneumocystis sp. 'macacae']
MGISGLLPLLKSIQVKTHIKQYSGKTIGIDAYIWLYKGAFSCAWDLALGISTERYVDYAMHRVKMLKHYGIKMFIVFDGGYLPSKSETENQRGKRRAESKAKGLEFLAQNKRRLAMEQFQKCINVTPEMAYEFIKVLRLVLQLSELTEYKALKRENIDYIVAPYEADAQLAYLEKQGKIDAILTEDSDLLVFGCKCILLKLDQYGECIEIKREKFPQVKEIDLSGWTDENFRHMAILSGCDYLASIRGIGLKTAYRLLKKYKTIDQLLRALKLEYTLKIPSDYETQFNLANLTFMHQRVYCLNKRCVVMWNEPEVPLNDNIDKIVGPDIPLDILQGLIRGEINPITRLPILSSNNSRMLSQIKKNTQPINDCQIFTKHENNSTFDGNIIMPLFASTHIDNSRLQTLSFQNSPEKPLISDTSKQAIEKCLKDSIPLDLVSPVLKIDQKNNYPIKLVSNKNNSSELKRKLGVYMFEEPNKIKIEENINSPRKINQRKTKTNFNDFYSNHIKLSDTTKNSGSHILNKCPWFNNISSEKDIDEKASKINIYEDKESYNSVISSWRQLFTHTSKNLTKTDLPLSQIATQNTIIIPDTEPIVECKLPKNISHARKLPSSFKLSSDIEKMEKRIF